MGISRRGLWYVRDLIRSAWSSRNTRGASSVLTSMTAEGLRERPEHRDQKGQHMSATTRIAVPTEGAGGIDAARSAHFGHSSSFTIVTVADGTITDAETLVNPPHTEGGCGMTVKMLADAGVSTAIVVGMGGGPMAAMRACGMTALFDDHSATPRAAVEAYLAGSLASFGSENTCRGH